MKIRVVILYPFTTLAFLIAMYAASNAQQSTRSLSIHGNIIDSLNRKPLSYSAIELYADTLLPPIQKAYTHENGEFSLTGGESGKNYVLFIKTLGYSNKKINLPHGIRADFNLKDICLEKSLTTLNEVKVQGSKPLIENRIDRLIFNPDLPTIQNSVTISDVLSKTPLLSLGQNGQLLLRGKPNVKIYLNDRPASPDAIKGMPAGTISSIEIMTNPSSKYDAEGAAIVNIITKRNKIDGYEGMAMIGGGIYDRINTLGNIAVRKSKFNISLNYTLNGLTNTGVTENRIERPSGVQEQHGLVQNKQLFQAGTLGIDYELDTLNKIGGSVNVYQYIFKKRFNNRYTDTNPLDSSGNFDLSSYDHIKRSGGYGDISYTHIFGRSKRTLNMAVLHNELRITDNLAQDQSFSGMFPPAATTNLNNEVFKETTYQLSFSNPFKNKSKFEIGSKFIVRNNDSKYSNPTDSATNIAGNVNNFEYTQHIFAVYGLYNFSLKKFSFQLGLRNETTSLNYSTSANSVIRRDKYNNLFPGINALYQLPNDQQLKVSYAERIQRPGIFYLNPYLNVLDPQNINTGTPDLQPEISHQVELDYSKTFGKSYLDFSIDYTNTSNSISSYTAALSEQSLITNYTNAGKSHAYSGNIFFSTTPFKNNNLSLNFTAENFKLSNEFASNSGWNYYAGFRDSYSWKNNFSLNLTLNYFSQQITLQGKSPGSFSNSLGISKSFLEKKLLLSFLTDDPFRLGGVFKGNTTGPGFVQRMDNDINLRTIQLRAVYYFGKRSSTKQHEKKVQNSDLKNGGL